MKTLITLIMLTVMALTGLASYHLFRESEYNVSALLIKFFANPAASF